jgi:diamine N-acetyltransferase
VTTIALSGCQLRSMEGGDIAPLAEALSGMDPWARLGYEAAALTRYLERDDPALTRWVVDKGGEAAGLLALRSPWLRGPYIELFAVLPGFQGLGLGTSVMDWAARHAAEIAPNLWACVSGFNAPARAFYASNGFTEVVELDGLVQAGMGEILLRRRLQ